MSFVEHSLQHHKQHLDWIFVSDHPDDVIMISPSSPLDADLSDVFTQAPAEQVLQPIYNIKNTHAKQTRSLMAM